MSAELFDALYDTLFAESGKPKQRQYHKTLNNYEIFKEFEQAREQSKTNNRNMGDILNFVGHKELSPTIYKELMARHIVAKRGVCYVLEPEYESELGVTYHIYKGGNKNHRAINWYWKGFDMILKIVREQYPVLEINTNMEFGRRSQKPKNSLVA